MITTDPDGDGLNAARGILRGVVLGALIWALVIATIWHLYRTPDGAGEQALTEARP